MFVLRAFITASLSVCLLPGCARRPQLTPRPAPGELVAPSTARAAFAGEAAPTEPVAGMPPWAHRPAEDCARCHTSIAEEWRSSMHAHSTAAADPLYRALLGRALEKLGPKAEKRCSGCHYPDWREIAEANHVEIEGVTCVVCHEVHPRHPEQTIPWTFARRHPDHAGSTGLCLSCHAELAAPDGRPVCTTGDEAKAVAGDCVDCHMESADGLVTIGREESTHASHRMRGGHWPEMVRLAASVKLEVRGDGAASEVVLTVEAGELGHAFPTGTPLRSAVARVEAFDAAGASIWRNAPENPYEAPPGALFARLFPGPDGKNPVPPFATSAKPVDTRLEPEGSRVLRYPLPRKAARLRAWLEYRLAPGPLLERIGAPDAWRKAIVVSEVTLTL